LIHEVKPSAELAEYVDAYWWTDASSPDAITRVIPDGCADVIFDPDSAFVVGTMTRPLEARTFPGMFGIRFRPGCAALVLRAPLTTVTDALVPLRDVTRRFPAVNPVRIESVEVALRSLLADVKPDRRVAAAVEVIIRSGGQATIERVAAAAGVSRQHLARAFAYHVGVSPKTFARVVRFRRALKLARTGNRAWADLAAELGYFDQSHLIAEFREFAGDTPVPFFLSPAE
jgi:AraC-like DNA-binding protein